MSTQATFDHPTFVRPFFVNPVVDPAGFITGHGLYDSNGIQIAWQLSPSCTTFVNQDGIGIGHFNPFGEFVFFRNGPFETDPSTEFPYGPEDERNQDEIDQMIDQENDRQSHEDEQTFIDGLPEHIPEDVENQFLNPDKTSVSEASALENVVLTGSEEPANVVSTVSEEPVNVVLTVSEEPDNVVPTVRIIDLSLQILTSELQGIPNRFKRCLTRYSTSNKRRNIISLFTLMNSINNRGQDNLYRYLTNFGSGLLATGHPYRDILRDIAREMGYRILKCSYAELLYVVPDSIQNPQYRFKTVMRDLVDLDVVLENTQKYNITVTII